MTVITNPKITSLEPGWAPFSGFSVLFDNPGNSLRWADGVQALHCVAESGGPLDLYARLDRALRDLLSDVQTLNLGLCALPPSAYHVTAWDGIHVANLAPLAPALQQEWAAILQSLPGSLRMPPASLGCVQQASLLTRPLRTIHLRFEALRVWGDQVLVAELAAADASALRSLRQCEGNRALLAQSALKVLGVCTAPAFVPHVSLGYFANEEGGRFARDRLSHWNAPFQERLADATIAFDSLAVYSFTDMAHFYRITPLEAKPA